MARPWIGSGNFTFFQNTTDGLLALKQFFTGVSKNTSF